MPHANRLFGLVIDEISGVDRDANGYAEVLIAKRDRGEEAPMALYDASTGQEIDEASLEVGDRVVNDAGEEFMILDDETIDQLTPEQIEEFGLDLQIPDDASDLGDYDYDEDRQLVGVGKADSAVTGGLSTVYEAGRRRGTKRLGQGMTRMPRRAGRVRNLGNGGAGSMVGKADRGLGDTVYEQLSKALGDDERSEAISKAFGALEQRATAAEQRAARAEKVAKSLDDQRLLNEYVALADEYGLPVDSVEFGQVLMQIGESGLSKRSLAVLDNVFASAAEAMAGGYNELGATGGRTPNSVMDMVEGAAMEHVGKADITPEQTVTALFDSHPELYDEYLAEQSRGY